MSLSLTELLDISQVQGQGVTGSDLMNPLNLLQKLGYSFLGTYALYTVGADEALFNAMRSAGVPEMWSAPAAATLLGAGADLLGGEAKRIVGNLTKMQ